VLLAAGWTVKMEGGMSFGPVVGLTLRVRSLETAPPIAHALRAALENALGSVSMAASQNIAEGKLELSVGSKSLEE
jgi:hypothetical protein